MFYATQEQIEKRNKKLRRIQKREAAFQSVLSCLRTIVYTPLSVAFHAVSFVTRGIGFISAFGMIAGVYYAYESICAVRGGTPFGEVATFEKAAALLICPFIIYGVSVITERIYRYFEDNAF